MKRPMLIFKFFSLFVTSILLTTFDFNLAGNSIQFPELLPLFLIIVIFTTFNNNFRWWYILVIISTYSISVYNNFLIGFFLLILIYILDRLINKLFQNRTFFFFILYSFIIEFFFYFTEKISFLFLKKIGWLLTYTQFDLTDLKHFFYKIILSISVIIVLYPLVSFIDARKILYTKK